MPGRKNGHHILAIITIGLALGLIISLGRALQTDVAQRLFVGMSSLWLLLGAAILAILVIVSLVIWRRPQRRTIAVGGFMLVAACLVAGLLFRIEGYSGSLVPRIAWRWSPTAEQRFTSYKATKPHPGDQSRIAGPAVDLSGSAHDHPGFLGARRDGLVRGVKLDWNWQARPPIELWRHPVGPGLGGFAIVGNFALTQEQRGPNETIVCYELRSGREQWAHRDPVRFSGTHGDGPRATPTVVAGKVYTMGATGLVTCIEGANGRVIWQKDAFSHDGRAASTHMPSPVTAGKEPSDQNSLSGNLLWGMAGSPLVLADMVIVTPGGGPGRTVVALSSQDGSLVWSTGNDPAAYASPALVELAGTRQILSFHGSGLGGYAALNGDALWLYPWVTQGSQMVNIAQPLVVMPFGPPAANEGFILVSSGYGVGTALLRVTCRHGVWQAFEVWHNKQLRSKMSNFLVLGDYLYGLDEGVLTCLDVRDGRRLWRKGRYGHGQMLMVDDLLLIQAESGEVVLVKAIPEEHRELARLKALSNKTWNHPALAGNVLIVRNDREAAAFELPVGKQP